MEEIIKYLNYVKEKGINTRGIIINECPARSLDFDVDNIQKIIGENTGVPVLGIIPKIKNFKNVKPEDWIEYIICRTDLEAIFKVKIMKLSST